MHKRKVSRVESGQKLSLDLSRVESYSGYPKPQKKTAKKDVYFPFLTSNRVKKREVSFDSIRM